MKLVRLLFHNDSFVKVINIGSSVIDKGHMSDKNTLNVLLAKKELAIVGILKIMGNVMQQNTYKGYFFVFNIYFAFEA